MLTGFRQAIKKNPYHYADDLPPGAITLYQYTPASRQAEAFHASQKHIKVLFGGDRSGKTGTVAFEMISLLRENEEKLLWSAALTEEKLAAIWEWHKTILHPSEYIVTKWRVSNEIPEIVYHTQTGSKMVYKTWKAGHGSFSAESVFAIHLDEDGQRVTSQAEAIWSDCLSRILDCQGFLFLSATPILGKNWMFRRVVEGPRSLIDFWHVSLEDNRMIPDERKENQLLLLNADEIDRRYYGKFAILSGACFKEFRPEISALTEVPVIQAHWRKIRVIDFGYNHPFYCGWYALDDDGVLWQYAEYQQAETLLADHARHIYRVTNEQQYDFGGIRENPRSHVPIEASIADHDSQDRAELENGELGEMAIYTIPAIKNVDSGIQAVNRWLKPDIRGKSRFYISPLCPIAQRQFESYHFKPVKDGMDVKEVVVKIDDESCDTGRYAVEYFDQGEPDYTIKG